MAAHPIAPTRPVASLLLPVVALLAGGCVGAPEPKPVVDAEPAPQRITKEAVAEPIEVDVKRAVADAVTPGECIAAARQARGADRARAWAILQGCVKRGRFPRGELNSLRQVLEAGFDDEFARAPEAPGLFAELVARRGGDVENDLKLLQSKRVPLFSLESVVRNPAIYKGRHVLMRAEPDEIRVQGRTYVTRLTEHTLGAEMRVNEVERTHSGYGRSGHTWSRSSSKLENASLRTTRGAIGHLGEADPFLQPGKVYVFLGRFNGLREAPPENGDADAKPEQVAVVLVERYWEPSALLID